MRTMARGVGVVSTFVFALVALAGVAAATDPKGEPVKWDQARVTQYSVELNDAIEEAVLAMRKSPVQTMAAQRQTWYDLKEDLRLLENTSSHLQTELQAGSGLEETRATFDRIEMLRHQAEEHGRSSMIPSTVMDALVKAGSLHNRMRPYYLGLR